MITREKIEEEIKAKAKLHDEFMATAQQYKGAVAMLNELLKKFDAKEPNAD